MYQDSIETPILSHEEASIQAAFMTKVYMWMTLALVITGITAFYTASSELLLSILFSGSFTFFIPLLITFGLVIWLTTAIRRMSPVLATVIFLVYSALTGLTLSVILLAYTSESVALSFFITAGTFAVMSVYGYVTKADLSRIGNIAIMGLIGIIIASLVNLFMESEMLYWIISYAGVAIFVALVAYDTQRLKQMALYGFDGEGAGKRESILGALILYLDFINLFLFLIRLFGRRD